MYISAGNAAYSVSTAFIRLDKIKFSMSHDRKRTRVNSLREIASDILHKHHYVRLIKSTILIDSNRQLGASKYLGECQGNQVSEKI